MAEINTLEEELVQTGKEIIKATDDLQKGRGKRKDAIRRDESSY